MVAIDGSVRPLAKPMTYNEVVRALSHQPRTCPNLLRRSEMTESICSLRGCKRPVRLDDEWCSMHFRRWERTGSPYGLPTPLHRFWQNIDRSDPDGCWLWQGEVAASGYGRISILHVHVLVHRFAYETFVGPIPADLEIDHLCRVQICVNPDHLEPVTGEENISRSTGVTAANATKTHCNKGHLFDDENTSWRKRPDGRAWRACKRCAREHARDRRAEGRAT